MRILEKAEILGALDEADLIARLREGFRALSENRAQVTAVGHLGFGDPPGDCHVKGGFIEGDPIFVVKLANSFYENPRRGLETNAGFVAIASAQTGQVLAILNDGCVLTDIRTAAAGAMIAHYIARPDTKTLGVIGTGIQARLQAQWISRALGVSDILIWGRDSTKAAAQAADLGGTAVSLSELARRSDLIVTCTPSTQPILLDAMVKPGCRIIAVGADAPGKMELDPQIFRRARVVVDSRVQCVDHGDSSWAVRAGYIAPDDLMEFGTLVSHPVAFDPQDIVIADMTGVAIQDVEIAKAVWNGINRQSPGMS